MNISSVNLEKIKQSVNSIVFLEEKEWQQLLSFIEIRKIKKNSYLLREGQSSDFMAFVNCGTLIYLKLLETGKEITIDFAFSGDWATDNRSRLDNSPSLINIKAIEESELLVITNENLNICYNQIPKLERLGRILTEQAFIRITQQSIYLKTLTAKERYQKLSHEHPEIFQMVPLYHIANYLGIAPKSLSRLRKG